jgi:glycolate oxidase
MQDIRERFQNLHEIVVAARAKLDRNTWDYLIGGAETETTVRRNRLALDSIAFRPRVLRNVASTDCRGKFLGRALSMPVALAPIGSIERFEKGACGTVADAAGSFGCGMFQSSVSGPEIEDTGKHSAGSLKIFQLYVRGDHAWVENYFDRAVAAGFNALCLTVDTAHYSRRERDIAKRYRAASGRTPEQGGFQQGLDWAQVDKLKARYRVPLIVKGVATAEDALLCVEHGVDVVYVSNHGGRQLDHGLGSIEVLPEIVAAVNGRAEIIIDGGFCRGTDIVKAIALGADAVGLGRLYCYALTAAGAAGIVRMLEILEDEVHAAMGLLGVTRLGDLEPGYLQHGAPTVSEPSALSAFPLLDG